MSSQSLRNRFSNDGLETASPARIVVMAYDRIDRDLAGAIVALEARDVQRSHDLLCHAQDLVHELHNMLDQIDGRAAKAVMHFLLRDFELDGLKANGDLLRTVCGVVAAGEPRARIECVITPQYRNMRYWLEKDMRPVNLANEACRALGIEPFAIPIRGGTDGSRLTEMGVPTPNLFTGMHDLHGPHEWISLQDMALATQLCVNIAELWGKETA